MLAYYRLNAKRKKEQGFTLIELSIVLVIIGLIVGGVLVGQDLIRAAEIRATISQIEKYNTAVNTFRGKFNAIPGDMNLVTASTFGFASGGTRSATAGQGDGNGVLDGEGGTGSLLQAGGETGVFWVDLSSSVAGNLIDGGFTVSTETGTPSATLTGTGAAAIGTYLPPAKLGRGAYIYVFEVGGLNYFGMSSPSGATPLASGVLTTSAQLTVQQAYNIDKKVDDGVPTTGNVQVYYINGQSANANATLVASLSAPTSSGSVATTNCYDTSVTNGQYEVSASNNGASALCALDFKFQ